MLNREIQTIIKQALAEDIGKKDITTSLIVSARSRGRAVIIAKQKAVLCGIKVARAAAKQLDKSVTFQAIKGDGARLKKGDVIAWLSGRLGSILTSERVMLNFLSLLSGVATATGQFVAKTAGTKVKILDTRKTTPGLRSLEKYAVRAGGGFNHRQNLSEAVLIKDNHLRAGRLCQRERIDIYRLAQLITKLRQTGRRPLEIEVESLAEFSQVLSCRPPIIMLDNFPLAQLKKAVALRNKHCPRVKLEVSGGVNLGNVRRIARSGVDFISVGSITHSCPAIDFSLKVIDS